MKAKLFIAFILFSNVALAQWKRINNSPDKATHLYFYNPSVGYALKGHELYKTSNGGTTWTNLPTGLTNFDNINDIRFVSQDTGFISVMNTMSFLYPVNIYMTINGGTTWNSLLGPFSNSYLDLHLSAKNSWYFYLNSNGSSASTDTIYHTTDGGITWAKTPNANTVQYNQLINNLTVFKDSTTSSQVNLFYKSTDGGATWNLLLTDNTIHSSFMTQQFLNNNYGYVLLYQYNASDNIPSKVYKTTDGGLNWVSYNLPANCMAPQHMHFTDQNTGYIVSNNTGQSVLFKTTDGGLTWSPDLTANSNEYFAGSPSIFDYFGTLYLLGDNIISNKIVTTSIHDLKKDKPGFNLFPNPSNGQLIITNHSLDKNKKFVITDIMGREMYSFVMEQSLSKTIDIAFLSNGLYLLKNKETSETILFVKD